jgi:hypothetical protein
MQEILGSAQEVFSCEMQAGNRDLRVGRRQG